MNSKIILESIDDVLNRLDSMSDEELQAKYESHKHGSVGRVFLESDDFFTFLINQNVEEYTAPVNNFSIEYHLSQAINNKMLYNFKTVSVINDDVYMLAI